MAIGPQARHPKGFLLKVRYAEALIARVERDLGYKLTHNRMDLLLDNDVCSTVEQARAVMRRVDAPSVDTALALANGDCR